MTQLDVRLTIDQKAVGLISKVLLLSTMLFVYALNSHFAWQDTFH